MAHCTVRRLMTGLGLTGGPRRGKKKRTTIADPQALQGLRTWWGQQIRSQPAPNVLWVADFGEVMFSTWSGWVYVAFVIDAYPPSDRGWRTATPA